MSCRNGFVLDKTIHMGDHDVYQVFKNNFRIIIGAYIA